MSFREEIGKRKLRRKQISICLYNWVTDHLACPVIRNLRHARMLLRQFGPGYTVVDKDLVKPRKKRKRRKP